MNDGNELTLLLTERCPAACSSCPLSCGPGNTSVMDEALAKELIDQAALGFSRLALSGGEPLLCPELSGRILRYAKDKGIPERKVVTGGFWGVWDDEKKEDALRDMKDVLTHAAFRFDSFHAEHMRADVFWAAVRFLDRLPIETVIEVADVYGERGAGAFLASLDERAMNRAYAVYPLPRLGRAKNFPAEYFCDGALRAPLHTGAAKSLRSISGSNSDGAQDAAPRSVAVDWDGNVFPCARPGIPLTERRLGNARRTPLAEIIERGDGS